MYITGCTSFPPSCCPFPLLTYPPHHLPHFQVSAIFIPYEVNAGASAAVFGLLGVLYVELFQFWQIVDHAWFELLKLSVFVVILLLLGTLPYVDNMAHVGTCTLVTRVS